MESTLPTHQVQPVDWIVHDLDLKDTEHLWWQLGHT